MKNKKVILVLFALVFSPVLLTAAISEQSAPARRYAAPVFTKGHLFITPQIGINSTTIPFSLSAEYAFSDYFGVGGTFMYWVWSERSHSYSLVVPSAEAALHIPRLGIANLDLSIGGGIGSAIGMTLSHPGGTHGTKGGFYSYIMLNGRYFITSRIAVNLRLYIAFGLWGSLGGSGGATFKI